MKLSSDLLELSVQHQDKTLHFTQNEIDPCIFAIVDEGKTLALLLTHVDDIMLMSDQDLLPKLQEVIKNHFPINEWENLDFEYVGCEYGCADDEIHIRQKNYATSRVGKVTILEDQKDDHVATLEQKEENRTAIGCVSWLAKQTRPDLQFAVCQCQRRQQHPTVADLKNTNKVINMCSKHQGQGVTLRKIAEDDLCILAYHDAAWGNVLPDDQEEQDASWIGEHTTASQLAHLIRSPASHA